MTSAIFAKIVLATDLSPSWDEIVACGGELKRLGSSLAILTHVITANRFTAPHEALRDQAAPRLSAQRRQLEAQDLTVLIETPVGLPASSLNEVAQKYDASLIILGSHGKSRWREGVLGSFSSAVLHNAQFPTLVFPVRVLTDGQPASCLWRCTDLLRHLLLPTDFSAIAAEALCYLELLAPKGVSRVTLLHALKPPSLDFWGFEGPEGAQEAAYNSLEVLRGRLEAAGVSQVHTRLAAGHPVAVILDFLQEADVSLVVLGTQGRGFFEEIFLGSVAHNVSRVATCPVLLIPPLTRERQGGS